MAAVFSEFGFWVYFLLLLSCSVAAQELPAGIPLAVRLSSATGSRLSQPGDPIEATIIAPVSVQGRILIPQGSRLRGSIAQATALGFGLKHTTASLAYVFPTLQLPDGTALPVNTQLVEVDTAKEAVDDRGTVHGIHPVVSLSSVLAFYTVPLLLIEPPIGVPVWGLKSLLAPSPHPEIQFPTGTELILRLTAAVSFPSLLTDSLVPAKPFSREEGSDLEQLVKNSAPQASMGGRPSDVVNLLLIGSQSQLARAFHAAGWSQAQRKSPLSLYRMYHALCKRQGYPQAPMNALTLQRIPSAFVYQKSLDTVQKRHHVRFWPYPGRANLWLGATAEDVGFHFALTHWTHATDSHIDRERAKVVNDLAFTGCVDAAGLRPRVSANLVPDPKAEHPIVTDGGVAVLRLNDCLHPRRMAGVGEISAGRPHGRLAPLLTGFRDDLFRANIVFTTYNTLRALARRQAEPLARPAPSPDVEPPGGDWLTGMTLQPSRSGQ